MEHFDEFNDTDVKNFETELSKIIKEVEANKKKQEELIQENSQLRSEIIQLKKIESRFSMTLEENSRLKKELDLKKNLGLSEKDLADVMLEAKRVANSIVQKSQDKALKIDQEKQKIMTDLKLEGDVIKENIKNYKTKINQDFDLWIQNMDQIIGGLNRENALN